MSLYEKVYGHAFIQNISICYTHWVSRKLIGFDCSCPSHESQLDGGKPVTAKEPLCTDLYLTFSSFIFHFIVIFSNLQELSKERGMSALKLDKTISPSQRYSRKDNRMFTGNLTTVYQTRHLVTDGKKHFHLCLLGERGQSLVQYYYNFYFV